MVDIPAHNQVHRAQLLGKAVAAQQGLDLDDPANFWYRQGVRDAYAYAAALSVTGQLGDATQAAADHVVHLLSAGVTDVGLLLDATDPHPRPVTSLTWVGQVAFDRLTAHHAGIDHDYGFRWGPRRDVRISHRLTDGATTGLLYAYDRTWEEYAVLDCAAPVDVVTRTFHAALEVDPNLAPDGFLALLRGEPLSPAVTPDAPGIRL